MKETLVSGLLGCVKCMMALAEADDSLVAIGDILFATVDS